MVVLVVFRKWHFLLSQTRTIGVRKAKENGHLFWPGRGYRSGSFDVEGTLPSFLEVVVVVVVVDFWLHFLLSKTPTTVLREEKENKHSLLEDQLTRRGH